MTKQELINRTITVLSQLSEEKAKEVLQFSEFLQKQSEEQMLQKGIEQLAGKSKSYNFLEDEPEVYTVADLKERYK